jgi:DNA-binding protein H-NS
MQAAAFSVLVRNSVPTLPATARKGCAATAATQGSVFRSINFTTPKMPKSYAQLLKQISTLQAEADRIRRNEMGGVVQRIREAIQHYGLTAADLGLGAGPKAKAAGDKAAAPVKRRKRKMGGAPKSAAVAKYGDGQGNTWVGLGKRPQWLRDALAAGKQLSDFLIKKT